jgi:hypothetical protein
MVTAASCLYWMVCFLHLAGGRAASPPPAMASTLDAARFQYHCNRSAGSSLEDRSQATRYDREAGDAADLEDDSDDDENPDDTSLLWSPPLNGSGQPALAMPPVSIDDAFRTSTRSLLLRC